MKTALILTGKYGSTNLCISNIMNNVIKPNNCDVFLYTFEDYYINNFSSINITNQFKIDNDDIDYIKNTIGEHLKLFTIEKTDKYDSEYKKMESIINNKLSFMEKKSYVTPMFFDSENNKIKDFKRYVEQYFINNICFKLLEEYENTNNVHYDAIIRLRIDAFFYEPFIMPTINHDKTLVCIGNPLEEWIVTSFFAGSRTTMKLILENGLDEMFIEPTKLIHIQNKEVLMHEIQFGCAIKQLCIKNDFKIIRCTLMANCIKLSKDGLSIHMGPYHTNKITPNDYEDKISKYIQNEKIEFRSYIFITSNFWTNCNEETKYKEIDKF